MISSLHYSSKLIACFSLFLLCISNQAFSQDINDLITQLNQTTNLETQYNLSTQIGLAYQKQQAHKKAIEYYQKAYQLKANQEAQPAVLQGIAYSHTQLKDYQNATQKYKEVLAIYRQQNNEDRALGILNELSALSKLSKQYEEALRYNQEIAEIQTKRNNLLGMTNAYNNIGFLYQQLGDKPKALEYFQKAIVANKEVNKILDNNTKAVMLTNTGVSYTNTGDFKQAKNYFSEALSIREKQGNIAETANMNNYLAANYYVSGNNAQALASAQKALELGNIAQDEAVLMTTYHILAEIYQKENDFREYQRYNQLYQDTKNRLVEQENKKQQEVLEGQINIEKKENELKSFLADKEKQASALRESELQREKQEKDIALKGKELDLLKRNQEIQQEQLKRQLAEKQSAEQLLEITQRKAQEEKQIQEIALLGKNKELQDLKIKEQDAKAKERQKEAELIEKERQKKMELMEKDRKAKEETLKYTTWIGVLIGLVLLIVLYSLYASQRARGKLTRAYNDLNEKNREIDMQSQEIMAQNEELHQNQEEIMAQRDFIEQKHTELAHANEKMQADEEILKRSFQEIKESEGQIRTQNAKLQDRDRQISSSINAAMTIQQAILPYQGKLERLLKEHFIIYHPKDVVSGDFYWLNEAEENKTVLIVADCTGHGVPGAFMTLIGSSLLDKIVRVWNITDPAAILTRLHEEVQTVLRQKEAGNNNGMDAVVVVMETLADRQTQITFSGAKNSLYYLPEGTSEVLELKGDRKSIGGEQNEQKQFQNQVITLATDSLIYLGTDGFIDQNDVSRKRFGEKRLTQLLAQYHKESFETQKNALETAIMTFKVGTEQRDDMLLIGVRV